MQRTSWFVWLLGLSLVSQVSGSHFRGGTITWIPDGNATQPYRVQFTFKLGWRRTNHHCDDATISTRSLFGQGSWDCSTGCSSALTVSSASMYCTSYSETEDWSQGERTFTHAFDSEGPFTIRFSGCCWISTLVVGADGRWSVETTVGLRKREDTGKINASPVSATAPIIRLQLGCVHSLSINTADNDDDEVRCRWANGSRECGGICNALINATLFQNPCVIKYFASTPGWHAVALTLEDYPKPPQPQIPLSQVPLQFLIRVDDFSQGCEPKLQFIAPTPADRQCYTVASGETFSVTIAVTAKQGASLSEVTLSVPEGTRKSAIRGNPPNQSVGIEWTPPTNVKGPRVFCFSALDNDGVSTPQRCLTVITHYSPPKIEAGTATPNNTDISSRVKQQKFSVTFDQMIKRPTTQKWITVQCREGNGQYLPFRSLDTSSSSAVKVINRTLTFYLIQAAGNQITQGYECYVEMDPGSVVGLQSCGGVGVPFEGIVDNSTWIFGAEELAIDDYCKEYGGRSACQHNCSDTEEGYKCLCPENYMLTSNKHTCYKESETDCPEQCTGNGVCLGDGCCDCRYGWQETTCFLPVCYNFADCSGSKQGDCISPNTCECKLGWSGPSCLNDRCSLHRTCSACSRNVGCGWCDSTEKCAAGTGYGPDRGKCSSWFYYGCSVATSGGDLNLLRGCLNHIAIIDCNKRCVDNKRPKSTGPGSARYCEDFSVLCKDYAECFQSQEGGCVSWDETRCPFGSQSTRVANFDVQRQRRSDDDGEVRILLSSCSGPNKIDVTANRSSGLEVVEEAVRLIQESKIFPNDHGLLRKIAWVESKDGLNIATSTDNNKIGIWQTDKNDFEKTQTKPYITRLIPDINKRFSIVWENLTHNCLHKPLFAALAARLYLSICYEPIPRHDKGQAAYWMKCYNSQAGNSSVEKFLQDIEKIPKTSNQDEGCKHGIRDPNNDCKCLCEPGYKGEKCDRPDCGCSPSPCSRNGVCFVDNDGKPTCRCRGRWNGYCCETCPPTPSYGEPHILTIDGFQFDYFGIGTFWSCISRANDFGVELAFFAYKHTSLVGAVALKIGNVVATIVTINNSSGSFNLPALRVNGTLLAVRYGEEIELVPRDTTVYVNGGSNGSAVVGYFFKFSHGATYNVEVRYSVTMQRQYIDTAIGPPIAFIKKTEGLCGTMDDNATNDLVGPNGTVYSDPIQFTESWRVPSGRMTTSGIWSWDTSNFYGSDLGSEYFDTSHTPQYDIDSYSLSTIKAAEQTCNKSGVPENSLKSCIFDVVVTGDDEFADQPAFRVGKCLHDCSNHGNCLDGTCVCTGMWRGEDCSEGGCGDCPANSRCRNGFCQCIFGYYYYNGTCVEASCSGVGDCTSLEHGRCQANDVCLCNPGYIGSNCSQRAVCSDGCSGHGECTDGDRCICDPNWSGERCDVPTCADFQECHDHGNCTDRGTCDCMPGWTGSSCGLPSCVDVNNCSSRGVCIAPNTCLCQDGFAKPDCKEEIICPSNCSGNGICLDQKTCLCLEGFAGATCDFPICPRGCSSQGKCVSAGFCQCKTGWTGLTCTEPSCEGNNYCSGHGKCIDYETCECYGNWTGLPCNVPVCILGGNGSLPCSGRGACVGPGVCLCNTGYGGSLCERTVEPTSATPSSSVLSTEPSTSDDSGSGSTELSTHDVTEISVASSSGVSGSTGLYTPIPTIDVTVVGLIQATIANMTVAQFNILESTFARAVAEAVTRHCNDSEASCSGQTTSKRLVELLVSPVDVIIVKPVAEEGPDVVVTLYVRAAVSGRDTVSGGDVQEALQSANGLKLLKSSGFTLRSVSVVSTPAEDMDDSGLTSGELAGIIIACMMLLSVGVIVFMGHRHFAQKKNTRVNPRATVELVKQTMIQDKEPENENEYTTSTD